MYYLALSNIRYRIVRSLISVFAISVGIALLLILVGMTQGSIEELVNRIKQVGADVVVQPDEGNFFMGLKSSVLPGSYTQKIMGIEGVKDVVPVVTWIAKVKGQMNVVYGVDIERFSSLGKKFLIVSGTNFVDGDKPLYEIMIDDRLAGANKISVSDNMKLFGKNFKVVGIYKQGIGARIIMPVKTLQAKLDQGDKVSFFYVKCTSSDMAEVVGKKIEEIIPDIKANVSNQFETIIKNALAGLNDFIKGISFVALFVSALIVLLTMYTTVLERTREIGIMKSLGASNFFVAFNIVFESIILSVFGVCAGCGIFFLAKKFIVVFYPLLTISLTPKWFLTAFILGVIVGIVGALFPAYLAARQNPAQVLRYE